MPGSNPLLVHDYFAIRGGGERLALALAEGVGASLMYGFRDRETYDDDMFPPHQINLDLPRALRRPALRVGALALRFSGARATASQFQTRIYSGVAAPFAAPEKGRGGANIYYCHTPPRFLYDQQSRIRRKGSLPRRVLQNVALEAYKREYLRAVDRMDTIIANSNTVRERISYYLGCDSVVVHPPCDTERFTWLGQGDYYLSTARLSRLKRVDRIVDAFRLMPDRKLVVASGGEELEGLRRRAGGASNIFFTGWVGEERLRELVGGAIATLYLPVDEDFGMSPVESMAAGKPVIGVSEGGLRETILPDETGILLAPEFTSEDIMTAVRRLPARRAFEMRQACEARAQMFSQPVFLRKMLAIMGSNLSMGR